MARIHRENLEEKPDQEIGRLGKYRQPFSNNPMMCWSFEWYILNESYVYEHDVSRIMPNRTHHNTKIGKVETTLSVHTHSSLENENKHPNEF